MYISVLKEFKISDHKKDQIVFLITSNISINSRLAL